MRRAALGVSFIGTLVVLIGGLIAATIAAIIIMNLFNTLSTQPYITVNNAYFVDTASFIHFHAQFHNVGRSSVVFKYMYIYMPEGPTLKVLDYGIVVKNDSSVDMVGEAEFDPPTLIVEPSGGTLNVLVKVNLRLDNIGERVLGVAVFDQDVVVVVFEKA